MTLTSATPAATAPGRLHLRDLLGLLGRSYVPVAFLARLPAAMLPLGLLLWVSDATGSYGDGGLVVAGLSVGGGLGGPLVGVLADRVGQRRATLLVTALGTLAGAVLLLAGARHPSVATLTVLAGLAGATNPQIGSMARARWSTVAGGRADGVILTRLAMSLEGASDETAFVVGPVLVSVVAGLASPTAALVLVLVVLVAGQVAFALHPSAAYGDGAPTARGAHGVSPWGPAVRPMVALAVAALAVGLVFGSTQTGLAARFGAGGHDQLTGPVYAVLGIGSATAALLLARLHRLSLGRRIVLGGAGLALAGVVMLVVDAPALLAVGCLLTGMSVAPVLVSSYALAERLAPPGWGTTTMTVLATANVVGVALGAASAGHLADSRPAAAFVVPVVAGALTTAMGLLLGRRSGPSSG